MWRTSRSGWWGNRAPDHVTISRFRARHQDALSELFFGVLGLCQQAGMVRVGVVAIDSTKLAADASLDANRTEEGLRREAARILEEAAEIDAREDELYGDKRGDELPEELADPTRRKARIKELLDRAQAAREELEAQRADHVAERQAAREAGKAGRPPSPELPAEQQRLLESRKYNITDPDSGIVRHRGMLMQGYNVQTAVGDGQVILAARPVGLSPDQQQLAPTLAHAEQNLKQIAHPEAIGEVLADGGYWNIRQVRQLQDAGQRLLVPPLKLPAGSRSNQPEAIRMREELDSPEGAARYRRRQQIVEPVFAQIKHARGIRGLLRRGQHAVQAEIDLIATTHNLLKLYRHAPTTA